MNVLNEVNRYAYAIWGKCKVTGGHLKNEIVFAQALWTASAVTDTEGRTATETVRLRLFRKMPLNSTVLKDQSNLWRANTQHASCEEEIPCSTSLGLESCHDS